MKLQDSLAYQKNSATIEKLKEEIKIYDPAIAIYKKIKKEIQRLAKINKQLEKYFNH